MSRSFYSAHDTVVWLFKIWILFFNYWPIYWCLWVWYVVYGFLIALKSDSTHHFFRYACTKSGSLRFSQFSGCWLILSVYIIMSFDFEVNSDSVHNTFYLIWQLWTPLYIQRFCTQCLLNKGNNKITELRTILQRESQNS
jgi:hypothetical protein